MNFTRRDLIKCLAAGGFVVAGKLWTPGEKVISIPKKPIIRLLNYDATTITDFDSPFDAFIVEDLSGDIAFSEALADKWRIGQKEYADRLGYIFERKWNHGVAYTKEDLTNIEIVDHYGNSF